jgi:methyl-accepting chemotaxis protein
MLDALKNLTGGKTKLVQKQTDELELLVAAAREERAAISAMLTTLTTRSQKLAPLGKALEEMTDRVTGVTQRLDDVAARLALVDDRTKALEEVDVRIQALKDAAHQAEQTTQKALGPRRRTAATSGSAAPTVVAGALDVRDGRDLEERARNSRRGPRPAAEG